MVDGEGLVRFGLGLVGVGLVCATVRRSRGWSAKPQLLVEILDSRLHYAVAGLIFSLTVPISLRTIIGSGCDLVSVFLAGIFGLVVGVSFDLGMFRRLTKSLMILEIGQLVLLVAGLWVLTIGFFQPLVVGLGGEREAVLWVVCGLGAASWVRQSQSDVVKTGAKRAGWLPSMSAVLGLFLAGMGLMELRPGGFAIRQPLAYSRIIVVEDTWEEIWWCLVLGALIGVLLDLAIREVRRSHLYYIVCAGLLLGCGIARVLGLEPLWVGAIAGTWLINSTLRRLDLLQALERGHSTVRTILLGLAGWMLGSALLEGGCDILFGLWILFALVLWIPVVRFGVWQGVGRRLDRAALVRTGGGLRRLLELDDLGLVVALSLAALLPAEQGAGLLAAVLFAQRSMHLVAVLAAAKLAQLAGWQMGRSTG